MQQVPNGKLLANRYHLYTYIGQPAFVFDESDPSVHLLPLNSSINLLERVCHNLNHSVQVVMSVIEPLVWWIFVRDQSYTYFTRHSFVSKEFEAAQGCQPPQQIRHSILLIARDSSGCTKPNPKVLRLQYALRFLSGAIEPESTPNHRQASSWRQPSFFPRGFRVTAGGCRTGNLPAIRQPDAR